MAMPLLALGASPRSSNRSRCSFMLTGGISLAELLLPFGSSAVEILPRGVDLTLSTSCEARSLRSKSLFLCRLGVELSL